MPRLPSNIFPSHQRLLEVCHYDPLTGIFTRRESYHRKNIGKRMGGVSVQGYRRIKIENSHYAAGPLAWFYVTGIWPADDIDHIDRDKDNNRFSNLREATNSQNITNRVSTSNTSGYRGVSWIEDHKKWKATLKADHKVYNLGYFDTAEEAAHRYDRAAKEYQGEFAIFNFPKTAMRDWLWVAS
jgi:hypothetical protein